MRDNGRNRIAVVGLYNSGSTGLAGMLHRLGVNMGAPFWRNSDENSGENYYEPYDIAQFMRRCWGEPGLTERISAADRRGFFRDWIGLQESKCAEPAGAVGAKHPLLGLCGTELAEAWGAEICFIWSWRAFDESIAGLRRRGWFAEDSVELLQRRLWDALHALELSHHVIRIDWNGVKADPVAAARQLALIAGVFPSDEQFVAAARFLSPEAKRQIQPGGRITASIAPFPPHLPKRAFHVPRKTPAIHQD